MGRDAWRTRGRYVAGLVLLAGFGIQAFLRGMRVPLLGWIDLAVHEAGHVFAVVLPDLATAAMGSGLQVALPLFLAVAFWVRERDPLGTGVCLGWAGTSFQDASVYIADAPFQRLPLIGGHHDWAWVFGPRGVDHLEWADETAALAWSAGLVAWTVGVAWCLAGPRLVRAMAAGHDHRNPVRLWRCADDVATVRGGPPPAVSSSRAQSDRAPAPARGPAGVPVAAAGGAAGRDDPADPGPGAADRLDTGRGGDPPRARVVW